MPKALDYVIGGWDLSGILTWRSGFFVRFGGLEVVGDPVLENPTPERWSDVFGSQLAEQIPAAPRRSLVVLT
jgi:hypothetical protein